MISVAQSGGFRHSVLSLNIHTHGVLGGSLWRSFAIYFSLVPVWAPTAPQGPQGGWRRRRGRRKTGRRGRERKSVPVNLTADNNTNHYHIVLINQLQETKKLPDEQPAAPPHLSREKPLPRLQGPILWRSPDPTLTHTPGTSDPDLDLPGDQTPLAGSQAGHMALKLGSLRPA